MTAQSGQARSETWPVTLEQAHIWIGAREPAAPASPAAEKEWRELAAQVYERVATTDTRWAKRAREWAHAEQETAFRLGAQIAVREAMGYYLGTDALGDNTSAPPVDGVDA